MGTIKWDDGNLITLVPGDRAEVTSLNENQLYGFFFYNNAQHEDTIRLTFNWSNSQPPAHILVPGTTDEQGLASMAFVWGGDSQTATVSVDPGQPEAEVACFIGSVEMPLDTSGIDNHELPDDSQPHPIDKFTRYFKVLSARWYSITMKSDKTQFIVTCFNGEEEATVFILNPVQKPKVNPTILGSAKGKVTTKKATGPADEIREDIQGDGSSQIVWINSDSVLDSENAILTLAPE